MVTNLSYERYIRPAKRKAFIQGWMSGLSFFSGLEDYVKREDVVLGPDLNPSACPGNVHIDVYTFSEDGDWLRSDMRKIAEDFRISFDRLLQEKETP